MASRSRPKNGFVRGGLLGDRDQGESSKRNSKGKAPKSGKKNMSLSPFVNPFGYRYPDPVVQGESVANALNGQNPRGEANVPLIIFQSESTKIIAYEDKSPEPLPCIEQLSEDYASRLVLGEDCHTGLGFHEEDEKEAIVFEQGKGIFAADVGAEETDTIEDDFSFRQNSGFLSIGGVKLYTEDISSDEENEESDDAVDDLICDHISQDSDDEPSDDESGTSSGSESDEFLFDSDSEIDDEVAKDYLEGIGGHSEYLKTKWLLGNDFSHPVEICNLSTKRSGLGKQADTALKSTLKDVAMKTPRLRRKSNHNSDRKASYIDAEGVLDEIFLAKDTRKVFGKKKKEFIISNSCPINEKKCTKSNRIPGDKKKHRKDVIAAKRRDRMRRRGVDLAEINLDLRRMVQNGVDMLCFQPMHTRGCSQVRKLASVYHLQSGCQGSGKKRFVTVTRTVHTCTPSPADEIRLMKLLGQEDEVDFAVANRTSEGHRRQPKHSNRTLSGGRKLEAQSAPGKLMTTRTRKGKPSPSYANQPVSFVSSGAMQAEPLTTTSYPCVSSDLSRENRVSTSNLGAFEKHTRGFGSKMMAKMGFVEGCGLGKDGQGMVEPISAVKRPKSLGLGVHFAEVVVDAIGAKPAEPKLSHGRLINHGSNALKKCSNGSKKSPC